MLATVLASPSDSLEQRVAAFNAWLLPQLDSATNALRVFVTPAMRIGAEATRDIASGDVYNALPNRVIMSRDTAMATPLRWIFDKLEAPSSGKGERRRLDFEVLLIFLINERRRGANSPWAPYLDLLPETYAHRPVQFDAKVVDDLQASMMRSIIPSMRASDRAVFDRLATRLAGIDGANRDIGGPIDWNEFQWASGVLNSRLIWWNNEGHLVPLLDAINCKSVGASRPHRTEPAPGGDGCQTRATRSFRAGEEVFEDYGQPNHVYFRYHGFTLDDNPHDCVLVPDKTQPQVQRCAKSGNLWGYTRSDLQDRLASYGSSLAHDESLVRELERMPPGTLRETRLATIAFRMSEKRLLKELIGKSVHTEL